jgi:ferric-dicitrate binding protein FerR (iron transport regulator)
MATMSSTPLSVVPAPAPQAETATPTRRTWVAPAVAAGIGAAAAALVGWWVAVAFPLSMAVGAPGF